MAILFSTLNPGTMNEAAGWGDGIYHCTVGSNSVLCTSDHAYTLRFLLILLNYSNLSCAIQKIVSFFVKAVVFIQIKKKKLLMACRLNF